MNLNDVMDQIGARLGTIAGLRVHDYPADQVTPPAAIVLMPDDIDYDQTYGRGMDRMFLSVLVLAGRQSDRASRDNLAVYVDGSGAKSVKAVLESGTYTAFDEVVVMNAALSEDAIFNGVSYRAALFDLDIAGEGGS